MTSTRRLARHLYLIGLRGTGKSTAGRIAASQLQVPFLDADEELERRSGRTIRDIFECDGEPVFRDLESAELLELSQRPPSIIATGGGTVLREENRRRMRESGQVIWLTASVAEMCRRLSEDPSTHGRRPKLTVGGQAEIEQLLAAREALYRECADVVLDTEGRSPGDVAQRILEACSTSC